MKILVVDDNAIVRSGLKAILTQVDSVTSVMEAGDAFSALEMNSSVAADIVLLDINMPGRSGLEILPDLATSSAVIMLTSNDDPYAIKQALDAGAKGYLVHGQLGTNEIVGAIETCKHGGLVLGREAVDVVFGGGTSVQNPLRDRLSDREAEILDLASSGLSNEDISTKLFLSERTVKNYLNSAYPKIGVHNRAQAVATWLMAGSGTGS